jgi:NAD(P)H-quinone oxidoreductase subunit I
VLETLTPPAKPAAKNEGQSSSEAKEGDA